MFSFPCSHHTLLVKTFFPGVYYFREPLNFFRVSGKKRPFPFSAKLNQGKVKTFRLRSMDEDERERKKKSASQNSSQHIFQMLPNPGTSQGSSLDPSSLQAGTKTNSFGFQLSQMIPCQLHFLESFNRRYQEPNRTPSTCNTIWTATMLYSPFLTRQGCSFALPKLLSNL